MLNYTKPQLERIIAVQLEHIDALQDLLSLVKEQNTLIAKINERLRRKLSDQTPVKPYPKPTRKPA
jgi:regulator of replication initiation timing